MGRKFKLQYSLILSYLTMVLIPLVTLGSIAFYISMTIVSNQTTKQDIEYIHQISNNVDYVISHMHNISLIAYSSTQLQNYINNENTDNIEIVGDLKVHEYLYSLRATDPHYTFIIKSFKSIVVYCNNYDYCIDQDYDFDKLDWVEQVKYQNGSAVFVPTYYPEYYKANNDPVFSVARQLNDSYSLIPLGLIIVNCKASIIDDIIGNDSDIIYIYDENDNLIYPYNQFSNATHLSYEINNNDHIQNINGTKYLVSKYISQKTNLKYVKITPYSQISSDSNLIIKLMMVTTIFTAILSIILSFYLSKRICNPINTLILNMNNINQDSFDKSVVKTRIHEIYELNSGFNKMMTRINNYIKEEYLARIRQKDIKYKMLQSQISPHFLFNTLESIRMMAALNNDEESANMIYNLANLYRYSIRNTSTLVPLRNEVDHIYHYMELQKMRFGEKFKYTTCIDESSLDCIVPSLILQPIVENSINHGLPSTNHTVDIILTTKKEDDSLLITISDSGTGFTKERLLEIKETLGKEENKGHIGLLSSYERIKYHFKGGNLFIESKEGKGTIITIYIPY